MQSSQHRTLAAAISHLELPGSFTLEELTEAVARSRGTSITIVPFPSFSPSDGIFGLWLATDFGDYVLHAPTESVLHRQQIILHELAHMILGHDLERTNAATDLFPDFGDTRVMQVLARGHSNDALEQAAEALGDYLAYALRRNPKTPFAEVFG